MICPECNGRGEDIYYVEIERDENTVTIEQRKGICRTCNGSGHMTQTNADRIRAMSDEELKYIVRAVIKSNDCPMGETECIDCVFHDLCLSAEHYYGNEEEWLKQPAEGE